MLDCSGVRFVPQVLEKKPNFQNDQKRRENRTNMHGHNFSIFSQASGQT